MSPANAETKDDSLWLATTPKTNFSQLFSDLEVDVAIVGSGITGLTTALLLKREGKKVAVLEHSSASEGDSGQTTAHLTEIIDTRFYKIISDFGKKNAKLVAESGRVAIEQIENLAEELNVLCGFKRVPAYLYASQPEATEELKKEFKALKEVCGGIEWLSSAPLPFSTYGAIKVHDQAQFHPAHYLHALALAVSGDGSFVFENTRALKIQDGKPCVIETERGKVKAKQVVVATHSPSSNKYTMQTKIAAYRTYAIAAHLTGKKPAEGLFWDTEDPYHYIREQGHQWVIGGEDHKTGHKKDTMECFSNLRKYAKTHFHADEISHEWSGQVITPVDGLPYIGRSPLAKNLYIATGFSGNGMTFGTLSGLIITDLIMKRKNPWEKLYRPRRIKPFAAAKDFIMENKDFPLCFVKDRLTANEVSSVDEIGKGEGRKMQVGKRPVAVYRDEDGEIHSVTAVCPHMGCIVHWNPAEKSWDCPCHGARFSPKGKMLNGPAKLDLKPVKLK